MTDHETSIKNHLLAERVSDETFAKEQKVDDLAAYLMETAQLMAQAQREWK